MRPAKPWTTATRTPTKRTHKTTSNNRMPPIPRLPNRKPRKRPNNSCRNCSVSNSNCSISSNSRNSPASPRRNRLRDSSRICLPRRRPLQPNLSSPSFGRGKSTAVRVPLAAARTCTCCPLCGRAGFPGRVQPYFRNDVVLSELEVQRQTRECLGRKLPKVVASPTARKSGILNRRWRGSGSVSALAHCPAAGVQGRSG